ncbi:MAG: hypothetical protein ACO3K7_03785 [Candidatus Marinamargulisbacteria bacterium]
MTAINFMPFLNSSTLGALNDVARSFKPLSISDHVQSVLSCLSLNLDNENIHAFMTKFSDFSINFLAMQVSDNAESWMGGRGSLVPQWEALKVAYSHLPNKSIELQDAWVGFSQQVSKHTLIQTFNSEK